MDAIIKPTTKVVFWCMDHKKISIALGVFVVLIFALFTNAAFTEDAFAIAPIVVVGLVALATAAAGIGIETATGGISDWLRDLVNMMLDNMTYLTNYITDGQQLTTAFSQIFESVYPTIYTIHQTAIVPAGNMVISIMFVVSLFKIMQDSQTSEGGIDIWRMIMSFFFLAAGLSLITFSFELLVAIYSLIVNVINAIFVSGTDVIQTSFTPVDEDVTNVGVLMMMLITVVIAWLLTVGVSLLSQFAIMARFVLLYVHVTLSPFPFACGLTEVGRPIATNFLKKYIANIGAGVVMALLFVIFAGVVGSATATTVSPDSVNNIQIWCTEITMSMVTLLVFGYGLLKSGSWAKDFVGL